MFGFGFRFVRKSFLELVLVIDCQQASRGVLFWHGNKCRPTIASETVLLGLGLSVSGPSYGRPLILERSNPEVLASDPIL